MAALGSHGRGHRFDTCRAHRLSFLVSAALAVEAPASPLVGSRIFQQLPSSFQPDLKSGLDRSGHAAAHLAGGVAVATADGGTPRLRSAGRRGGSCGPSTRRGPGCADALLLEEEGDGDRYGPVGTSRGDRPARARARVVFPPRRQLGHIVHTVHCRPRIDSGREQSEGGHPLWRVHRRLAGGECLALRCRSELGRLVAEGTDRTSEDVVGCRPPSSACRVLTCPRSASASS